MNNSRGKYSVSRPRDDESMSHGKRDGQAPARERVGHSALRATFQRQVWLAQLSVYDIGLRAAGRLGFCADIFRGNTVGTLTIFVARPKRGRAIPRTQVG